MLALRAIDKAYGAWRALAGVTLEVAAGEAVLLVGRNGAGKTTLLRIATGFMDPDAGEVMIDGVSMAMHRARAQAKLGYLPEHAPAPHELLVRDHLTLRAHQKGLRGGDVANAVDASLDAAAIADHAGRPIGTLSKGYRQRVGLADALLGDPPLLILDEPTSGMDPIQTRQLCDQLVSAARKRAVLVSSHAVADLEPLAARVAVLRKGHIVADAAPAALCAQTGKARLEEAVIALLDARGEAA
ncbi:MAG: ABC transporter ATP-binding protein [Kofleriaceae bacterium]|nr:ABC transporter ATP-binding protein [Kofleriaceae bacterium]